MNSRAARDSFPRTFFAPECAQIVRSLNCRRDIRIQPQVSQRKNSTGRGAFRPVEFISQNGLASGFRCFWEF